MPKTQAAFTNNQRSFEIAKELNSNKLILAVDPGKLTGIVTMTRNGVVIDLGNYPMVAVYELLDKEFAKTIQLVIMEEYIVGSRAAKLKGSRNEASQVIGVVRAWANVYKIPVVMQMPGIKTIAEKLSGKTPKGAHKDMHWLDAFNHGYYWLHSVGLVQPNRKNNG